MTTFLTHLKIPIIILVVLCIGCKETEESTNDSLTNPYYVTYSDAQMLAENILYPPVLKYDTTTTTFEDINFSIKKQVDNSFAILGQLQQNRLYVFNYLEGGFVIIPADKRLQPVLAYSLDNSFDFVQGDFISPGLETWINDYLHQLDKLKETEKDDTYLSKWKNIEIAQGLNRYFIPENCTEYSTYHKQLLQTKWGQGCGYNNLLEDTCVERCEKVVTGCVATAICQLLKYYSDNGWNGTYTNNNGQFVSDLSWEFMPESINANGERFNIDKIMKDAGEIVLMSYGCGGSGSTFNVAESFKNNYGFPNAVREPIQYSKIHTDLVKNNPVYLRGCMEYDKNTVIVIKKNNQKIEEITTERKRSCHAWVCSGFTEFGNCGSLSGLFRLYYMNWGWDGRHDGFFKFNVDDPETNPFFHLNRAMVRLNN